MQKPLLNWIRRLVGAEAIRADIQRAQERLDDLQRSGQRMHDQQQALSAQHEQMAGRQSDLLARQAETTESLRSEIYGVKDLIARLQGTADNGAALAGAGLTAVNEHRMYGLDLLERTRLTQGRIEARQLRLADEKDWTANQFRVYSQYGEDGLLQFIFRHLTPVRRFFVEFGVEDYREANTRFLLMNDDWAGFIMDGDPANRAAICADAAYLRYDLRVAAAFITRENINDLLRENGASGPIGLLSIDIDGNDYHVWEALSEVEPDVVIVEYNYRFGPEIAAVVPYDAAFVKTEAHPSAIYYGASLAALRHLAAKKGFALVGCSGGVNAFFVRRDRLNPVLREVSAEQAYLASHHAEMRNAEGRVVKASLEEQRELLLTLPLEYI